MPLALNTSCHRHVLICLTRGVCRYVTRDRVQNMLDYEYLQCFLTLKTARGKDTAFFAFADTVVAKAFNRDNECHGWLGIKYQSRPG